jgi:rSAM/selenodomain-associated transferase 2/rSAM/selenodomain-associated transferase 1
MNNSKEKLILFTRYPIPGKAKTRLIPKLGEEGAARLQEIMTGLTVLNSRCFSAASGVNLEIRFDGASKKNMLQWLGKGLEFYHQGGGDLGQRMNRAFNKAFQSGYERVVVIGCDCPQIDDKILSAAFEALKDNDMAIGPAFDGGYYLIGLRKPVPELFIDIDWGIESVFERTITIAKAENIKVAQLQKYSDVDCPQDIALCRNMGLLNFGSESISIIIAALNEEASIQKIISIALEGTLEVIVADGGSQDNTVELAQQAGASTLDIPYGRACQFNSAALKAKGDILLFLHADTILPHEFAEAVIQTVKYHKFAAGAFRLGIDSKGIGIHFIETAVNLRSRLLKLPYGDQALFVTKDTFLRMGGFADMPIMEDFEFIKRLRQRGCIITLDKKVQTSARRWLHLGVIRTTMINQLMIAGYKIGISPENLAGFYYNQKKRYLKINTVRKDTEHESIILRTERSR